MANTIQGAKSKLYLNKDEIPGISDIQANDNFQHVTAPEIAGQRVGLDVVIHGRTTVSSDVVIAAGSVRRKIVISGHALPVGGKGYFLIPTSGNAVGEEVSILSVVDANTLIIAAEINMTIGDTVDLCRYITPSYTEAGDLNVVINDTFPIKYLEDGLSTTVSFDTIDHTLSKPLPVNIVQWDGTGISTTVDLTGSQINVQLSDRGGSPDSVRVGDGTNLLGVNASLEALVHDQDVLDAIADVASIAKQDEAILVLEDILADLQLKADKTETQPVSISGTIPVSGPLTDTQLRATPVPVSGTFWQAAQPVTGTFWQATQPVSIASLPLSTGAATEAKQDNQITQETAINTILGVKADAQAADDTGSYSIIAFIKRALVNWTTLLAKLPSSLGAKTGANSFSVVPASDASFNVVPQMFSATITSAQIAVGTSRVRATVSGSAPSASRKKLFVKPTAGNTGRVWIGGSAVTIANGLEIIGPDRLEFELDASDYYVISDTAAQTVDIMEGN
jgi:hypothetical protein